MLHACMHSPCNLFSISNCARFPLFLLFVSGICVQSFAIQVIFSVLYILIYSICCSISSFDLSSDHVSLQLRLVLHLCARICVSGAHTPAGLHHKADGESMEHVCQTVWCSYGITWTDQRISGLLELPGTVDV